MKRKFLFGLLIALVAVLLPVSRTGWGPIKAYAYHSGSESDLAANPEMSAVRSFAEISLVPVESRGLLADTARLTAIGKFYTDKRARALEADTARWVALGGYYTGSLDRGLAADTARWVALGKLHTGIDYEKLLANPELLSLGKFGSCGC